MTDRLVIKENTTREKILQTAIKVFSQKGFHETRMEEIAQKASVAKGTIYLYFKTKRELFSSLLSHALGLVEEAIRKGKREGQSPLSRLENLPGILLEVLSQRSEFFHLIFNNFLLMDPESRKVFQKWKENMIRALSSDLEKIPQKNSQTLPIKARIIFFFLLSLFLGFLTGDLEIKEEKTMEEIKVCYRNLLGVF
ncbi:MAG: TetR/AcrR family transcriptional regulator [Caldiserica bacterium]|jgi:AcrR family transcriptional regulator|nr:TetR/AcrR family transcriptional regulator [Caldisericota bacterium]MDH7562725.1 helix-turn-helix domain-containing protein [Caldisericota bacterium]